MTTLLSLPRRDVLGSIIDPMREMSAPQSGVGNEAKAMKEWVERLKANPSTIYGPKQKYVPGLLSERLFDTLAELKVLAARFAMHLDEEWRSKLFAQLDRLLDSEEWDEEDQLPDAHSFTTFLRFILFLSPSRQPGLGLTDNGNFLAFWTVEQNRLTIECLANDEVRWTLVRYIDDERETAAGTSTLYRLSDVLAPYDPKYWFSSVNKLSSR